MAGSPLTLTVSGSYDAETGGPAGFGRSIRTRLLSGGAGDRPQIARAAASQRHLT